MIVYEGSLVRRSEELEKKFEEVEDIVEGIISVYMIPFSRPWSHRFTLPGPMELA